VVVDQNTITRPPNVPT